MAPTIRPDQKFILHNIEDSFKAWCVKANAVRWTNLTGEEVDILVQNYWREFRDQLTSESEE